jgi:uncharacterized membrane protein YqjE
MRAIRHGEPSDDPTLRLAEENLVERIKTQYRWSVVAFPVLALAALVAGLVQHDETIKWYFIASAVLLVAAFVTTLWTWSGARKYLLALGGHQSQF